jgi:hypothetical protein
MWAWSQELSEASERLLGVLRQVAELTISPAVGTLPNQAELEKLRLERVSGMERVWNYMRYMANPQSWDDLSRIEAQIANGEKVGEAVIRPLQQSAALGRNDQAELAASFQEAWMGFLRQLVADRNACKARSDAAARELQRMVGAPGWSDTLYRDNMRHHQEQLAANMGLPPWSGRRM